MADTFPKRLGLPGAQYQGKKISFRPGVGETMTHTWKGERVAAIGTYANLRASGYACEYEDGPGPNATVTAILNSSALTGQAEVPGETWELLPGYVEKDILEADKTVINALTKDQKQAIRNAVATPPASGDPAGLTAGTAAHKIYLLMLAGMRSVRLSAPILKHTQTVSTQYAVQEVETSADLIITTATLLSTEALPPGFLIDLTAPAYAGADKVDADGQHYSYGWHKDRPTLSSSGFSRLQIVQEWQFGLWPQLIYLAPI